MANLNTLRTWNYVWDRLVNFITAGNGVGTESPFGDSRVVIDSPMTLYVDVAGDDTWEGTSERPFKTPQKAINYLKDFAIRAPTVVQLGAGTFPGFAVEGITTEQAPGVPVTGNTLTIQGTLTIKGTFGLATGVTSNSGTATSGGSGVLNDTNQNWTVNELKGKLLEYNTSTGPATTKVWIVSNTATSITMLTSTAPLTGAYRILEHQTSITPSYALSSALSGYGVIVSANNRVAAANDTSAGIIFDSLDFGMDTSSLGYALLAMGSCQVLSCRFYQSTGSLTTGIAVAGKCNVNASNTLFKTTKATSTGVTLFDGSYSAVRTWHWGTTQVGQQGVAVSTTAKATLDCRSAALYESMGTAIKTTACMTQGIIYGTWINNITCIDVTGNLHIQDSKTQLPTWPHTSAGNTNFVLARGGTKIGLSANIPSGLATNDITMSSANPVATYTLAQMRALTPQAVTDTLGTVVGTVGVVF